MAVNADEKWFTFLTARERAPGQADPTTIRTDVFVSQFPMAGVALLNRAYDSEAAADAAAAAQLAPSPPVAVPRRKRGRQDPPAVTQDPYNQLRSATRVVDVLTVVEQLDNVRGATTNAMVSSASAASSSAAAGVLPSAEGATSLSSSRTASYTAHPNGTASYTAHPNGTASANGTASGAPTDVYTLDNTRRESAKPNSGRYHVVAILGPLESRDAAIAVGMLWRFNIRNVESRRMRGYLLGLYFRLGFWVDSDIERVLAAPPPPSVSKRRVVEKKT